MERSGRKVLSSEGNSFGNYNSSKSCSDNSILILCRSLGAAKHAGQLPSQRSPRSPFWHRMRARASEGQGASKCDQETVEGGDKWCQL
jgi:hypothetical protein